METNIIFFKITDPEINVPELVQHLYTNGVFCGMKKGGVNRFVIHHYIREEQVEKLIDLLQNFKEKSLSK